MSKEGGQASFYKNSGIYYNIGEQWGLPDLRYFIAHDIFISGDKRHSLSQSSCNKQTVKGVAVYHGQCFQGGKMIGFYREERDLRSRQAERQNHPLSGIALLRSQTRALSKDCRMDFLQVPQAQG